ncbi:MAG: hypothetical protein U5K70_06930 [Halodesulfurarchaeum sp.]|nr:hypothetical protein [Halodesulfurarchaeum sp.]
MNRLLTVLVALAMILSVTGPVMALAPADSTELAQTTETEANDTAVNETPPGVMFAGSIAVQQEEMRGEIEHRSFGLQIAAAATNRSKAQVLNRTHEHLEERLTEIETEMERLNRSRANGSISEGQYQVRLSALTTRVGNLEQMANSTSRTAATLPRETLEANGVNVTALEQLRTHARNMTGPETAAIARQIAGDRAGTPMGPPEGIPGGPPEGVPAGPGGDTDNDTRMGPGNGSGDRPGTGMTETTTEGTSTNETADGAPETTESAPTGDETAGNTGQ